MKTKTKLAIGIFILTLILYFGIVGYLYYLGEKDRIIQNNCNFNFSYNFTNAVDNFNNDYNDSIHKLNGIIRNEK